MKKGISDRDALVISARRVGATYREIAQEVGVGEHVCRYIIKKQAPELRGRVEHSKRRLHLRAVALWEARIKALDEATDVSDDALLRLMNQRHKNNIILVLRRMAIMGSRRAVELLQARRGIKSRLLKERWKDRGFRMRWSNGCRINQRGLKLGIRQIRLWSDPAWRAMNLERHKLANERANTRKASVYEPA